MSRALKALSGGLAQRRNCLTDVWLLARAHSERGYPTVASQLRGPNTAPACAPGWHRRILKTKETQQLQAPPFWWVWESYATSSACETAPNAPGSRAGTVPGSP